jgi:hypothetical protein
MNTDCLTDSDSEAAIRIRMSRRMEGRGERIVTLSELDDRTQLSKFRSMPMQLELKFVTLVFAALERKVSRGSTSLTCLNRHSEHIKYITHADPNNFHRRRKVRLNPSKWLLELCLLQFESLKGPQLPADFPPVPPSDLSPQADLFWLR